MGEEGAGSSACVYSTVALVEQEKKKPKTKNGRELWLLFHLLSSCRRYLHRDLWQEGKDRGRPLHVGLIFLLLTPPLVGPLFRQRDTDLRQEDDDESGT